MTFEVPQKLIDGVVRQFDPVEVYLFGSQARGDARPDSDIDLYVVIEDARVATLNAAQMIGEARRGYHGAVDIVVTSESRNAERKRLVGTLAEIVKDEGLRVYARNG